jgi:hypothetical protein
MDLICVEWQTFVWKVILAPWRCGLVASFPPDTEETGAMGRNIEARQGIRS